MTLKLEIYKCNHCGNTIEVTKAGSGELVCCGEKMELAVSKSKEEGREKHIPVIKEGDDSIYIQCGETEHPMTPEHYIEWIEAVTADYVIRKYFKPGERPVMTIEKKCRVKTVRAFCNKHGLWKSANAADFTKEDMILFAIKSERSAKKVYLDLANRVKNIFLKERFLFLAGEEEKHDAYFEELYKKTYLNKNIVVPPDDVMPVPAIKANDPTVSISEILTQAMDAEISAYEFYMEMASFFSDSPKTAKMLKFFASMEMIHHSILAMEKKNAEVFESYETEVPMIHVGP